MTGRETSVAKALSVIQDNGVTVIALGPEYENLNDQEIEELTALLFDVGSKAEPPLIVLDLSHTKFFGSAFIEVLFRAWSRVHARPGGKFALSNLTPYCREVVDVTHLDQLWSIFDNRDEAVRALRVS